MRASSLHVATSHTSTQGSWPTCAVATTPMAACIARLPESPTAWHQFRGSTCLGKPRGETSVSRDG